MKYYTIHTTSGVKHEGLTAKELLHVNPKIIERVEEYKEEEEGFWL